MYLRQFLNRPSATLSYLLACPESRRALMIDPVQDDLGLYLAVLDELGWSLDYVLETHLHVDHVTASAALRRATGALVACGDPGIAGADRRLLHGERLALGRLSIDVIATPGHTPYCLSYLSGDRLFTGDCLLIDGCGNVSAQGADAGRLYDSVTRKLFCFADETLLYPGHEKQGRQVSCVGDERRNNPMFNGGSRDEFIARMVARQCILEHRAQEIAELNRLCGLTI